MRHRRQLLGALLHKQEEHVDSCRPHRWHRGTQQQAAAPPFIIYKIQ